MSGFVEYQFSVRVAFLDEDVTEGGTIYLGGAGLAPAEAAARLAAIFDSECGPVGVVVDETSARLVRSAAAAGGATAGESLVASIVQSAAVHGRSVVIQVGGSQVVRED